MIHTEERHWKIIQGILKQYPYQFYGFGSRIKGTQKPLSDLDLVYIDPIPSHVISALEEDFSESDLPYFVDIVDWNSCSPEFQKLIKKEMVPIIL